ncbi:BQ2448_1301 [Microbotryum intermedium]|uniref:BQ2448_1301 protein n=1 Tax=Microbotryum intermedium TaxID=269621 RepID=A0A238F9T2_9BASI|nr:BQ2448_1301 [Microbotryum intermedium]
MSASTSTSSLWTPLKVGRITLGHRIVMAPLTRIRADQNHVPQQVAAEYYEQRSNTPGTLLISEATFISPQAGGMGNVPGIWSEVQIQGWKKVVDAVHSKGGFIFLQLWALGRAASADNLKNEGGFDVVSASDVAFEGGDKPRPLTEDEIKQFVADYATAAKNFVEGAGGDGVESDANGYLIQQFLETNSNKRTDRYGGSVENRARFGLEVVDAVTKAVGADRTGIRLSPYTTFQGMKMPEHQDIIDTYTYYVKQIKENHPELAYVHAVESRIAGNVTEEADERETLDFLYDIWAPSPFLLAGGFKREDAEHVTAARKNTAIVYGRYFISNPDLVERVRKGVEFADYDRSTFYIPGPQNTKGYIDYPKAT